MKRIVFLAVLLCLAGCRTRSTGAKMSDPVSSFAGTDLSKVPVEDYLDGFYDSSSTLDEMLSHRDEILSHPEVKDCYGSGGSLMVVFEDGASTIYFFDDLIQAKHVDADSLTE